MNNANNVLGILASVLALTTVGTLGAGCAYGPDETAEATTTATAPRRSNDMLPKTPFDFQAELSGGADDALRARLTKTDDDDAHHLLHGLAVGGPVIGEEESAVPAIGQPIVSGN